MSASDQRLIDLLFAHRAADDLFNCACGWHGDGFGDLHRLHQLGAFLSSPDLIDVLQARGRLARLPLVAQSVSAASYTECRHEPGRPCGSEYVALFPDQAAKARAQRALAHAYPETFAEFYAAALAELEAERADEPRRLAERAEFFFRARVSKED